MTNHSSTMTINGKTFPVIEWNPMWHPSTYILSERANMQLTNIRDKFLSNRELLAVYEGKGVDGSSVWTVHYIGFQGAIYVEIIRLDQYRWWHGYDVKLVQKSDLNLQMWTDLSFRCKKFVNIYATKHNPSIYVFNFERILGAGIWDGQSMRSTQGDVLEFEPFVVKAQPWNDDAVRMAFYTNVICRSRKDDGSWGQPFRVDKLSSFLPAAGWHRSEWWDGEWKPCDMAHFPTPTRDRENVPLTK